MTVAVQPKTEPPSSPPKAKKEFDYIKTYIYLSLLVGPILTLALLYIGVLRPYGTGRTNDADLYSVLGPTLAAMAALMISGLLLAATRAAWAVTACVASAVGTFVVYIGCFALMHKHAPLDLWTLIYLALPVAFVLLRAATAAQASRATWPKIDETITKKGTATYTAFGLVMLFAWLLWFDICWSLMEGVLGLILQVRLKNELNTPAFLYTVFMVTLPSIINFFLNPIISIASDRHRGPRGRRIPYLLYGGPVVCACLALLGFGNEIGAWVHSLLGDRLSLEWATIWTFGVLLLVFTVFNMFIGTTFYYLFNDVVPDEHFVKFMGYMRAAGTVAGMIYGWYIQGLSVKWGPFSVDLGFWRYENEHFWFPKLVLVGAAVFYTIAGTIAILKIREPQYPPPAPLPDDQRLLQKWGKTIKVIAKECFSHKFYVLYFITCMVDWMTYNMSSFMNPMRENLGMDFDYLGKFGAVTGWVSFALILLTANYGDRFKPLPLMVVSMCGLVLTAPVGFLFLIPGLSSNTYFWIQISYSLTHLPVGIILGMAASPLAMSIMPNDRFGQFGAAQSMMRMILPGILGSMFAGWLMGVLENAHGGTQPGGGGAYAWRYAFVWNMIFQTATLVCYYLLYKEWKRLGGRKGFKPPPVRPWETKAAA